jgi:hypothetical protein
VPDEKTSARRKAAAEEIEAALAADNRDAAAETLAENHRAAVWRAEAVRNMMAYHRGVLLTPEPGGDASEEERAAVQKAKEMALAEINAVWSSLDGRTVE